MKVQVDQDLCIACGLCISECPAVFDWNKDEKADTMVNAVPAESEACCRGAIGDCPTLAIGEA
jgi:ferredoxin